MMDLTLRRIKKEDVDLIYSWANDPVVRKNSFSSAPIAYKAHCEWFADKCESDCVGFYILSDGEIPVGQVRYEVDNDTAYINYAIAEEYRGKGYGSAIIAMGETRLVSDFPQVKEIIARVKKNNVVSATVFRHLGYSQSCEREYFIYKMNL